MPETRRTSLEAYLMSANARYRLEMFNQIDAAPEAWRRVRRGRCCGCWPAVASS
jgi:hypothetical protein